ncbi:MAG: sugar ABC transporter permease, partial [Nitrospinota bacterium]
MRETDGEGHMKPSEKTRLRTLLDYVEREHVLGYLMLLPAGIVILFFIAYPFGWGVYLSFTNKTIGMPWSEVSFVRLKNYINLWTRDGIFWQTVSNTFLYTGVATVIKWSLGITLAILLNREFKFKRLIRAAVLPWIVPTVLSTLAYLWIFDPDFSIVNWTFRQVYYTTPVYLSLFSAAVDLVGLGIVLAILLHYTRRLDSLLLDLLVLAALLALLLAFASRHDFWLSLFTVLGVLLTFRLTRSHRLLTLGV